MTSIQQRIAQRARGVALCILVLTTAASSQTEGGFSLGLRAGGLIGSTELTDKAHVQAGLALRRPLRGSLLGELGGGYARLDGTKYATDLAVGELRFLFAARSGRVRPVAYAGVGAVRYNLATSPPQRTADVDALGVAPIIPAGLGLQFVLGGSTALEILAGYTYSLKDDINGATTEKGNDVIWGMTVGLTFGGFGPSKREERPPSVSPPTAVSPPPVEIEPEIPPEPVDEPVAAPPPPAPVVAEPEAPVAEQPAEPGLILPPVYFATGSARVSPNGMSLIAEIAKALERHEVVLLEVRGYADTRGSRGRNFRLAWQRAAAVKAALVDRGIEGWRITPKALGETEPQLGGVWLSRRVEIVPVE